MTYFPAFIFVFFASFLGVKFFRLWSLKREIYDVPNERSSHTAPIPVGGGLVIDLVCLSTLLIFCLIFRIGYFRAYFIGALALTLISWLDDIRSVRVGWRFLFHIFAAFLVIWDLGFWDKAYIPFIGTLDLGYFGLVLTFFWIVWLINAYNFMDGIDGIAAAQAVCAGVGWAVIGLTLGYESAAFYAGVVAFSSFGFLMHNWEPAKIFMGDVGSAFLGYTFAVMPLLARKEGGKEEALLPIIGASLVSLFLFDSLLTLARRLLRGEKVWNPHREHIYQRLVISGLSHRKVVGLYSIISGLILLILIFWVKYRET